MNSLRGQLTMRLLCGGALLLGAAGVAVDWQMRRALTAEFDATLRSAAQSLTAFTEHKGAGVKLERESATLPQFDRLDSGEVFLLRTAEGRELQRSRSLGEATLPLRSGAPETPVCFDTTLPDGRVLRCAGIRFLPKMAKRLREQNEPAMPVVLMVGRDRSPLDRTLAALHAALLLIGGGALAGLTALVGWGVRSGLKPLERLGDAVAAVDAHSLTTRFPDESLPVELRPIARRLNELLARMEESFAREQRFTATAAHELRTPLAELRSLAEVNLTTPSTDEERTESWRDALATTERMQLLALRLLELTRSEDPARVIHREPIPLAEAVEEAWRPWKARAVERGIALQLQVSEPLVARTDSALLAIILGNLCGNAAEHAPAGATLSVTATLRENAATLFFRNPAIDLTEKDLPHLFERFWRKDAARSNGEHHGLGLALAAEFAQLLGGALTAQLAGELEFALRLPSAEELARPSSRRDHTIKQAADF